MEKQTEMKKRVLFVCAENSGRSQMAEAFFNHLASEKGINWQAESSGTFPADEVNPLVIAAMAEKEIDIQNAKPKLFIPEKIDEYGKVISYGCLVKGAFPKEIQLRIEDWHMDDPKDQTFGKVREIRDEIERKIIVLMSNLV